MIQGLLFDPRKAGDVLQRAITEYQPRKRVILFSGGKDSSVTLDYMWRNHRSEFDGALHLDTGIGEPSTQEFAIEFCRQRDIPLEIIKTQFVYEEIIREHGFPGAAAHRYMYTLLKERPLRVFIRGAKTKMSDKIALITGVRLHESKRRMGTTRDVNKDGAKIWVAPLIDWTTRDMQEYREKYSVEMSPAATAIHLSGECLCGAFGSQEELQLLAAFCERPAKRIFALQAELEAAGNPRCKWGVTIEGDKAASKYAPGPMCVGCQLTLDVED